MFRNVKQMIMLAAVLLALIGTGTAFAFSQFLTGINVRDPETMKPQENLLPVPFLAPPATEAYTSQPLGTIISAPDHRPVAQLGALSSEIGESIAVSYPTGDLPKGDEVAWTILSSVRYSGSGHTILVTTSRPSAAAAKEQVVLGSTSIQLASGTKAWIVTDTPLPYKDKAPNQVTLTNQVIFLSGDLIITVASDLPGETLTELASSVVIEGSGSSSK